MNFRALMIVTALILIQQFGLAGRAEADTTITIASPADGSGPYYDTTVIGVNGELDWPWLKSTNVVSVQLWVVNSNGALWEIYYPDISWGWTSSATYAGGVFACYIPRPGNLDSMSILARGMNSYGSSLCNAAVTLITKPGP